MKHCSRAEVNRILKTFVQLVGLDSGDIANTWLVGYQDATKILDTKLLNARFHKHAVFVFFYNECCIKCLINIPFCFACFHSKMINLSVPDTIDERTINKKKLTPFTIQVN